MADVDGGAAAPDPSGLYDRRRVEGFVSRVTSEARDAGLNVLELYHAANSVRMAALAQMAGRAASRGEVVEVGEGGRLKVSQR